MGSVTNLKAAEEDAVGAYGAEADPIAPEATAAPETADKSAAGAESYDFKEYDLKEYDLGTADGRLYDYGAYDEYGTGPPAPKAGTYDDEVGPGVAAETETESSVSTPHPRPGPPRQGCAHGTDSFFWVHPRLTPVLRLHAWCLVFGCGRCCVIGCPLTDGCDSERACLCVVLTLETFWFRFFSISSPLFPSLSPSFHHP